MTKAENVINYYVLCNKLKDVIRTGWQAWSVKRDRIESVADHIYGVQMLAIAMKSEYEYDIDILKVIYMLAVHELEEIYIGDITHFQMTKEEKMKIGHEAVIKVLGELKDREKIMDLIKEFDERQTKEALFAHFCDKLECSIQCKLYDLEACVDLTAQEGNTIYNNEKVQELLKQGKSWSDMWITYWQDKCQYDEKFLEVSNYVMNNDINC